MAQSLFGLKDDGRPEGDVWVSRDAAADAAWERSMLSGLDQALSREAPKERPAAPGPPVPGSNVSEVPSRDAGADELRKPLLEDLDQVVGRDPLQTKQESIFQPDPERLTSSEPLTVQRPPKPSGARRSLLFIVTAIALAQAGFIAYLLLTN